MLGFGEFWFLILTVGLGWYARGVRFDRKCQNGPKLDLKSPMNENNLVFEI